MSDMSAKTYTCKVPLFSPKPSPQKPISDMKRKHKIN